MNTINDYLQGIGIFLGTLVIAYIFKRLVEMARAEGPRAGRTGDVGFEGDLGVDNLGGNLMDRDVIDPDTENGNSDIRVEGEGVFTAASLIRELDDLLDMVLEEGEEDLSNFKERCNTLISKVSAIGSLDENDLKNIDEKLQEICNLETQYSENYSPSEKEWVASNIFWETELIQKIEGRVKFIQTGAL